MSYERILVLTKSFIPTSGILQKRLNDLFSIEADITTRFYIKMATVIVAQ